MVKGVNRQMIEIRRTDHPYFERALLIVRGDLSEEETAQLHTEAGRLMKQVSVYITLSRNRRRLWLRQLLWACGGAVGAAGLMYFLLR